MKVFLLLVVGLLGLCRAAPIGLVDIETDGTDYEECLEDVDEYSQRNGLRNESYRWPNKTVNFYINDEFDQKEIYIILLSMQHISLHSCIRFKEVTPEHDYYVNITKTNGCSSTVGFRNRVQRMSLDSRCFRKYGTVVHEFLHALGFHHMQSNYNRDEYVQIFFENIKKHALKNFEKQNHDINDFGEPYDFASILHYPAKSFSKNGKNTIEPLQNKEYALRMMGQRYGMSKSDIKKLNKMYKCNED